MNGVNILLPSASFLAGLFLGYCIGTDLAQQESLRRMRELLKATEPKGSATNKSDY